jgi:hypothetical protein
VRPITLAELRKVSKPTVRHGQSRYVSTVNSKGDLGLVLGMSAPLSRVVGYSVVPRLERGQEVEVRWTLLARPTADARWRWTEWRKVAV